MSDSSKCYEGKEKQNKGNRDSCGDSEDAVL